MIDTKKSERGAVIVEIIAVIALLGVMGPLLFKQVLTRNEEVENINMASEIRVMKEALSAYVLTNKQAILSDPAGCQIGVDVIDYLPVGMDVVVDDYVCILCRVESGTATAPTFVQGFVVPTAAVLPEDMGLKRSARVANLIGSDGGIYYNDEINGTAGGWGLDADQIEDFEGLGEELAQTLADADSRAVYLATTGMDTYVPEYIVEDYSSGFVTIPNDLAFGQLHAANYFSIGDNVNCYEKKHHTMNLGADGYTAADDIIKHAGEGECSPLFWVGTGADSGAGKLDQEGDIYVKKGLSVGYAIKDKKHGVSIMPAGVASTTDTATYHDQNRIEVYNSEGNAKVIINGDGRIIARSSDNTSSDNTIDGEVETLTIADGQIKTNIKAVEATHAMPGTETALYKVDPAYTSIMHDIRLESRGGARLSEILPNYISKEIFEVTNESAAIPVPSCPTKYAPAIVVVPTALGQTKIASSDVDDFINKDKLSITLSETEKTGTTNHKHDVAVADIALADVEKELETTGLYVQITESGKTIDDKKTSAYEETPSATADTKWIVKFFYSEAATVLNNDARGLAHTYCVYKGSKTEPEKKR